MGFDVSSFAKLQAKPMLEMGPALPSGMVEVAQEILKTSKSLQVGKLIDLIEVHVVCREMVDFGWRVGRFW